MVVAVLTFAAGAGTGVGLGVPWLLRYLHAAATVPVIAPPPASSWSTRAGWSIQEADHVIGLIEPHPLPLVANVEAEPIESWFTLFV
ncbi:MAG: hypothetical protein ACRDS9_15780, partial [Pseudonocardiaceae bacterium]